MLKRAQSLLRNMNQKGIPVDSDTYASLLQACANDKSLMEGKLVHAHMILRGFEKIVLLRTKLLNMYVSCGSLVDARKVFDKISKRNIFSWNAMIRGYATYGHHKKAIAFYHQMHRAGMEPGNFTFPFVLKACAALAALQLGKDVHNHIIRSGLESDDFVGNALVTMYAKCGSVEDARQVFDKMSQRDVVSWTAMIAGYAHGGHANEALKIFRQMQVADVKADSVTVASVLPACAHLASLRQGKEVHNFLIRTELESNCFVLSALIDMYAKCGNIETACQVFDRMPERDVVSWNAIIEGHGMHGHCEKALILFGEMRQAGVMPNDSTFVAVLSACSHSGLVDEGWRYFDCMSQYYRLAPSAKHYACMVDLLGRSGRLDEAKDFIDMMPFQPDAVVWGSLLGACKTHCNAELAVRVAERLFELEPENVGNYLLLSNIYAHIGRWDDVAKMRTMIKNRGLKRRPGCSWIVVKDKVHAFLVGDTSHPELERIYAVLEGLGELMEEGGYVPDTRFVLGEEEK